MPSGCQVGAVALPGTVGLPPYETGHILFQAPVASSPKTAGAIVGGQNPAEVVAGKLKDGEAQAREILLIAKVLNRRDE